MRQFNVIIDTREKTPWGFSSKSIGEVYTRTLATGDYAVEGLEDVLCIERKRSVNEIAGNSVEKRFKDVIERMKEFRFRYILVERSMADIIAYPVGSSVPKKMWSRLKIKGAFVMKWLAELEVDHGISVILCGNEKNAIYTASNIMKRVVSIVDEENRSKKTKLAY